MKTLISYFLAALTLAAAMNITSCKKEQPDFTREKREDAPPVFAISLDPRMDFTAYKDNPNDIPFTVTESNGDILKVESQYAEGADVRVTLADDAGTITFTPKEEKGVVKVTLSNGLTSVLTEIDFNTYYINVTDVPNYFGEGNEFTFKFNVETNLPSSEISVTAEPWMKTSYADGEINVTLAANESSMEREGTISVTDTKNLVKPVTASVLQNCILVNKPGMVPFTDRAFKKAILDIADSNGDGEISTEEAEAVTELEIIGKGIRNLDGLECFKNVWKVDARDNDIENADVLSNLRYLCWLDLSGNYNLKSFDVTGCTMYFEHCRFEVSDELNYRQIERQIGVGDWEDIHNEHHGSDFMLDHATLIKDYRKTSDWSRQNIFTQVQNHTKGNGKNKFVVVGTGFIDEDLNNGTYTKIMQQGIELIFNNSNTMKDFKDYLDIFIMDRLTDMHNQWCGTLKEYLDNEEEYKIKYQKPFNEEYTAIQRKAFAEVTTGNENDWQYEGSEYRVFLFIIHLGPHPNNSFSTWYTSKGANEYHNKSLSILDIFLNILNIAPAMDIYGIIHENGYAANNAHVYDFAEEIQNCDSSFNEFTQDLT